MNIVKKSEKECLNLFHFSYIFIYSFTMFLKALIRLKVYFMSLGNNNGLKDSHITIHLQ